MQEPQGLRPFNVPSLYQVAGKRQEKTWSSDNWTYPICPLAWPGIAPADQGPILLQVALRETYHADLAFLEILTWPLPEGLERDKWIVRGLPLGSFLHRVLSSWQRGDRMAPHFRLKKRLPPQVWQVMWDLPIAELPMVFAKLRQEGALNSLRGLSRSTWPSDLPWETGRWCFLEWPHKVG